MKKILAFLCAAMLLQGCGSANPELIKFEPATDLDLKQVAENEYWGGISLQGSRATCNGEFGTLDLVGRSFRADVGGTAALRFANPSKGVFLVYCGDQIVATWSDANYSQKIARRVAELKEAR